MVTTQRGPCILHFAPTSTDQWNVTYQRQVAANWMVSASHLGNFIDHIWYSTQINPAIGQCCGTIGSPFPRANQVLDDP